MCQDHYSFSIHSLTRISVFFVLLIAFGRFPSTMTTFTQGSYTCMRFNSLSKTAESARNNKVSNIAAIIAFFNCLCLELCNSTLSRLRRARNVRVEAALQQLKKINVYKAHLFLHFTTRWTYFSHIAKCVSCFLISMILHKQYREDSYI